MINTKDTREGQRRAIQAEREELKQAPRQHFLAAGREFTRGWAALAREFAERSERSVLIAVLQCCH